MSEKHSPLPWAATTRKGSWDWVIFQEAQPHLEVCQMFHDGTEDNEKGEANAELVVRAVNERDGMLAEIELLKQRLEFAEWEWGRATDGMKERAAEIERLREQLASARKALGVSIVAIDDWLNIYASEFCDPKRVEEAQRRVGEYGTVGYIAHIQRQNRAALTDDQQRTGDDK